MAETSEAPHSLISRLIAEAFGTFLLVFGVIGTALFTSSNTGILGVALAIGLTVVVGAYAFGPISGAHFNPAVTLGAAAAGRLPWRDVVPYIIAQIVGGVVASSLLLAIAAGGPKGFLDSVLKGGFASNGFGDHSPAGFNLLSVILVEFILTAFFLWVILGVTHRKAAAGFAPLAIGLALTLIHLIAIPVSNASVNPARSIATAIFGGPAALGQLWVFILVPILGALVAGFTYRALFDRAPLADESYLKPLDLAGNEGAPKA
ncbi:aquaporin Z [Glaciihabitans sp. UYNi722]|uniref:aquaporin Z n=1 Tax=Glaciihabitans sp. UYNi722 TaxID=3156344 RepID=UPI003392320E